MTASATTTSPETLGALFARTAVERPDESALRTDDGAIELSWAAYAAQAHDAAAGLAGLGVRRGDTLACWLSNCPAFHVADRPRCCSAPSRSRPTRRSRRRRPTT